MARVVRGVCDSRGVEIVAGQKVAYNRSGDVIEGTVLDVKPSHVKIQPSDAFNGGGWPSVSRVRNRRSILVLP